ncbi:NAD(P)H:quinone oxidoreductase [Aliidiomarina haloalkalitolerans]|uniref:NAD(P)H dehydrogenase (quinone) n=1 Tax=Aliidiomarina haloalkalitolerans TaxID=859059 RepID=A0A432VXQ3_9GAMM|nr:NAD(P)H:quinone oxidoreductase [Aliidiomarina haloalkalitolerans]RUO21462.1 NAD(P)H:quinone oxidoreductase [Aliidiomarina haloalkalitolerans]
MAKILVLYYSSYGHVEQMAYAAAQGAQAAGAQVDIKRVPELVPSEIAERSGYHLDQQAPIAKPEELSKYDAILFGAPTRFGMMAAQMKNFLDQCGGLWANGELIGKAAGVFTSSATQHGGQESTLLNFHTVLLHFGFVVVGLPYSFTGQMALDQVTGCSPYGASTIAGGDGKRQPSELELAGARFQGEHLAKIAKKLSQP